MPDHQHSWISDSPYADEADTDYCLVCAQPRNTAAIGDPTA